MDEFATDLRSQLELLSDYCSLYDGGKVGHALSIAARLDVICQMLRSQRGKPYAQEKRLTLVSNARRQQPHDKRLGFHPLACARVYGRPSDEYAKAEFFPMFRHDQPPPSKQMKIGAWMREPVLGSSRGQLLSRGVLISQMRNKGGGAHPYSEPQPDYKAAASKSGLGLAAVGPQGPVSYDPPAHFATMRHMAHEVLTSPTFGT